MQTVPQSFTAIISSVAPKLSQPTHANMMVLMAGWIACVGRHSITRVIQFAHDTTGKHHSVFYRFFTQAKWCTDGFGPLLIRLLLPFIAGDELLLVVDDTLRRSKGSQLWGRGMFYDPLLSNYGKGDAKAKVRLSSGRSWVVLSVWVPLPWNSCGIAVPIALRLYRNKKHCSQTTYRKRTELAKELIELVMSWDLDRKIGLVGDSEYGCRTLVRELPSSVHFTGPMCMDAALYAPVVHEPGKRGRPRKKGKRLSSPSQLCTEELTPWNSCTVEIYGKPCKLLVKTQCCLWYTVAGTRLVKVVVTRDPKGRFSDRAYFSTNAEISIEGLLQTYARRWSQEVQFRNIKQHFGLGGPHNGWWQRVSNPSEPQAAVDQQTQQRRKQNAENAARRTTPFIFLTYAIVVIWYLKHGNPKADVLRVRLRCPWYRHKRAPSFADMHAAARRELWGVGISKNPPSDWVLQKTNEALAELLAAA